MRLGISGAQSVGKTTLLNALRSETFFENYEIVNEVTRKVLSYGMPINEQGTDITQRLIMNEHIYNVFMFDKVLVDRTALDGLVYSIYLHNHGKISSLTLKHVRTVFKKVIPNYTHIFYIEPEFKIEDDGTRSTDINFRDEIAELFQRTIEKEKLSVARIGGTVRNRVDCVLKILEE